MDTGSTEGPVGTHPDAQPDMATDTHPDVATAAQMVGTDAQPDTQPDVATTAEPVGTAAAA